MQSRVNGAMKLANQGKHDEAAAEFEWLWDNMANIEPDMYGVRISLLASSIRRLIGKHQPTHLRFTHIRDRTAMLADTALASVRVRLDWIVLNEILGEQERTLA